MKKGIQLVALLLTVVMSSCTGGKDKAAVKQEDEKPRVKVADVTARPVDQIQDYTATVEAEVKNNIAPSSPVRIDRILVEVGDRVSKGQKLVQMDAANLTQTKLQLDNQKIEFNRIDELYKVGGASKSEWDAAKMQLDVKQTAYDNLVKKPCCHRNPDNVIDKCPEQILFDVAYHRLTKLNCRRYIQQVTFH